MSTMKTGHYERGHGLHCRRNRATTRISTAPIIRLKCWAASGGPARGPALEPDNRGRADSRGGAVPAAVKAVSSFVVTRLHRTHHAPRDAAATRRVCCGSLVALKRKPFASRTHHAERD